MCPALKRFLIWDYKTIIFSLLFLSLNQVQHTHLNLNLQFTIYNMLHSLAAVTDFPDTFSAFWWVGLGPTYSYAYALRSHQNCVQNYQAVRVIYLPFLLSFREKPNN